eukprot:1194174-Prorocentrum_minimum.AAC.2
MVTAKVCGVANPEDALFAAKNGADFIGMIIWPKSKRSIGVEIAKEVAAAAREGGAEPVGVFVSENADELECRAYCAECTCTLMSADPWTLPTCVGRLDKQLSKRIMCTERLCDMQIVDLCGQIGLDIAQLHGDGSR